MKCTLALRWSKSVVPIKSSTFISSFYAQALRFRQYAGIFLKTILQLYFNKFNPVPGTHREDTKLQEKPQHNYTTHT